MATYSYEYTDTFGGDANYSWVRRGMVAVKGQRAAIRKVRAILGLNGVRGRSTNFGDQYQFNPANSATVLFISYEDEANNEGATHHD